MIVREYLKLDEDVQQAKSILKKNNIKETDSRFVQLKSMLEKENKLGYLGKFTKWLFVDNTPFQELKDLFYLIVTTPSKIDPIHTFSSPESMYDKIKATEITSKTDSLIKQIPSRSRSSLDSPELRELIASHPKNWNDIRTFLASQSGGFTGSYKKPEDLVPSLEIYLENLNGEWNLEYILKDLSQYSDINYIYKSPALLVFTISKYETSQKLCSQEWCITTSRGYFDSYVDLFSSQFLIYDFTKKPQDVRSIIGSTIEATGEIKEMMFKNNHNYYYPNHPQPHGYNTSKLHDPAIAIKDYMEELLSNIEPN